MRYCLESYWNAERVFYYYYTEIGEYICQSHLTTCIFNTTSKIYHKFTVGT